MLLGLLLGEVLDALQTDETAANTVHQQRTEEARDVDEAEMAARQTDDLHEWLASPDDRDFTTVDTPMFANGVYEPTKEWEDP